MRENETLGEVKDRIQKKLQVPDEDFSKVGFYTFFSWRTINWTEIVGNCMVDIVKQLFVALLLFVVFFWAATDTTINLEELVLNFLYNLIDMWACCFLWKHIRLKW